MTFHQQFLEDLWLHLYGGLPAKGVYVDVGAADPVEGSMTAWLRERGGWEGLAIDGNGAWASKWKNVAGARFVHAVLAGPDEPRARFRVDPVSVWESRIGEGGLLCDTATLGAVLDVHEVRAIDFLCLDVEGHEFEVLQGFDLPRYWPRVIVSEYNTAGIGEDYRVRDYLLATGRYEIINQTLPNLIFRLKS